MVQQRFFISVAPYEPPDEVTDEEDFETREGVRVMAIAFENNWEVPAFGCLVNGEGEVTDYLRLANLLKRKNSFRQAERDGKIQDMEKLKKFLLEKKPHVVVISSESRESIGVKMDVEIVRYFTSYASFERLYGLESFRVCIDKCSDVLPIFRRLSKKLLKRNNSHPSLLRFLIMSCH